MSKSSASIYIHVNIQYCSSKTGLLDWFWDPLQIQFSLIYLIDFEIFYKFNFLQLLVSSDESKIFSRTKNYYIGIFSIHIKLHGSILNNENVSSQVE